MADEEELRVGPEPHRRRWLLVLGVVVVAAGVTVALLNGGDEPAPSPTATPLLGGDPRGTLDTAVVRASGSCPHVADCPLQPDRQPVRGRVAAALSAALGVPASVEVRSRATRRGGFYSRVVTADTPLGRVLLVAAVDNSASSIVVVHAGADTVFARDYRGGTYIDAVLTGRNAAGNVGRLQRLAADPRVRTP